MPKYTNDDDAIDLNDYKEVKELTNGQVNEVYLYQHKHDSNLKIVVKIPHGPTADLIQHNIRAINAFFGEDSAWPINGKIKGQQAFAMKYYQGKPLTPKEEKEFVNNDHSPIRTISKKGLSFTILDPNKDNFLKLSTGEIIPIDFDYMIMHDEAGLLPYQKAYLDGRRGFAIRQGNSSEEATQHVLNGYPLAASYLYANWGERYLEADKYVQPSMERAMLSPEEVTLQSEVEQQLTVSQMLSNRIDEMSTSLFDSAESLLVSAVSFWGGFRAPENGGNDSSLSRNLSGSSSSSSSSSSSHSLAGPKQ